MSTTQSSTGIASIGRVMVPVTDQDAAVAFYTDKLGLEVVADVPYGRGDRWVEVAPVGTTVPALALVLPREGTEHVPADGHVALTTKDIDATHAAVTENGVDADDVMRMGDPVPPMFFLRDQDGNTLLLVEDPRDT